MLGTAAWKQSLIRMIHRLAILGDSWAYGAELEPGEKSFGQIIGDRLDVTSVDNVAVPGSSIPHTVLQLKGFLDKYRTERENPDNRYTVLVFLTSQQRHMTWHDRLVHLQPNGVAVPNANVAEHNLNELYYKYFSSDAAHDYAVNTAIVTVQGICREARVNALFVAGWQKIKFWSEVDTRYMYENGKVTCADMLGVKFTSMERGHELFSSSGGHPNQQGHQVIADRLIRWVTNQLIY